MIVEYTYSSADLANRCHGCKWLKLDKGSYFYGTCECQTNKIKNRRKSATDRCCTWKERAKGD